MDLHPESNESTTDLAYGNASSDQGKVNESSSATAHEVTKGIGVS